MLSVLTQAAPGRAFTFDELLDLISTIGWWVFAIYAVITFVMTARRQGVTDALLELLSLRVLLPLFGAICITLISLALVFVQPQEVAVIVSVVSPSGVRSQPFRAGLHWIIPILEHEERYPISWQTYTMSHTPTEGQKTGDDSISARTSDGQEVRIDCSIIFRVDLQQAVRVYIDWQDRYTEDLLRPVTRSVVRTQVSQFTVKEVNSSARKDLEATLDQLLAQEFRDKGLVLDQFLLRDISFTPQYAAAVEQKQVALEGQQQKEYEAEQIRRLAAGQRDQLKLVAAGEADATLLRAEADAKASVLKAKAQAEGLQAISEVLIKNRDLLTYEYIQRLSPSIRAMLVPNNTPLILPLQDLMQNTPLTPTLPLTATFNAQPTPLPPNKASAPPSATPTSNGNGTEKQ
jgi:regulator of protease activity HflC (stomatin/prohibitin superfamily)